MHYLPLRYTECLTKSTLKFESEFEVQKKKKKKEKALPFDRLNSNKYI